MKKDEKKSRQNQHKNGNMNIEQWFFCPHCGRKLFAVEPGAFARGIACKCKSCKNVIKINI